jgi:hypothetical protein
MIVQKMMSKDFLMTGCGIAANTPLKALCVGHRGGVEAESPLIDAECTGVQSP